MDQSIVARFEREERVITLAVARASELIFGIASEELFPSTLGKIEASAIDRIRELRERLLQRKPTQTTLAKLELLKGALDRATTSSAPPV